jgi:hypothetical protein
MTIETRVLPSDAASSTASETSVLAQPTAVDALRGVEICGCPALASAGPSELLGPERQAAAELLVGGDADGSRSPVDVSQQQYTDDGSGSPVDVSQQQYTDDGSGSPVDVLQQQYANADKEQQAQDDAEACRGGERELARVCDAPHPVGDFRSDGSGNSAYENGGNKGSGSCYQIEDECCDEAESCREYCDMDHQDHLDSAEDSAPVFLNSACSVGTVTPSAASLVAVSCSSDVDPGRLIADGGGCGAVSSDEMLQMLAPASAVSASKFCDADFKTLQPFASPSAAALAPVGHADDAADSLFLVPSESSSALSSSTVVVAAPRSSARPPRAPAASSKPTPPLTAVSTSTPSSLPLLENMMRWLDAAGGFE